MARRIVKDGYFCLLPDSYYRLGTCRCDVPRRDDGITGVIRAAMNHLTNARVVVDTAALLAYFDAQDKVKPGPVGCVGHCMSGQYITTASARFPPSDGRRGLALRGRHRHRQGGFAAPAARQNQGRAPLRLCRDRPCRVPSHIPGELKKALDKADVKHEVEVFPGTQHGCCFPSGRFTTRWLPRRPGRKSLRCGTAH